MKKRVSHKHFGLYSAVMAVAIAIPLIPSIGINVEEHLTGSITGITRTRVSRRDVIAGTSEAKSKLTQLGETRRSDHPLAKVKLDNATINTNRDRILRTLEADRKAIIEKQRELKTKLNTPGLSVQSRALVREEIKKTTEELRDTNKTIRQFSTPLTVSVTPLAPTVPANAVRSERRDSGSSEATRGASPTPSSTPSDTIPAQPIPGTGTPATPAVPSTSSSVSSTSRSSSSLSSSSSSALFSSVSSSSSSRLSSSSISSSSSTSTSASSVISSDSFSSQVCTGPACNADGCNGVEGPRGSNCCADGLDNDRNGVWDAEDPSCMHSGPSFSSAGLGEICGNGIDDDRNGLIDNEEPCV